jgi:hypothetical protein
MPEPSEILEHPKFGKLGWMKEYSFWSGAFRTSTGQEVDLMIEPHEERFEFLERAACLFDWALTNERAILQEAISSELLELYNGSWHQSEDPILTADELTERLQWHLLVISKCDIVPIEFSYGAGELFGNHAVVIEVGSKFEFRDIDLRG